MTGEEAGQLWLTPDRWRLFESLTGISEPVRVPDLVEHVRALGFTEFTIPLPVAVFQFMASAMFHRGARVGHQRSWLVSGGNGPLCHLRADRALIPDIAAAVS